ncbi:MAG: hypothetical protein ACKPKO_30215, partial [Candidatus Fonsibacter sp.]
MFRCGFLAVDRCLMQYRCRLGWMSRICTETDALHHPWPKLQKTHLNKKGLKGIIIQLKPTNDLKIYHIYHSIAMANQTNTSTLTPAQIYGDAGLIFIR